MAGFIRRVIDKTTSAFERLVSGIHSFICSLNEWIERINRHGTYITAIEESTPVYVPEVVDIKLAEELKHGFDELACGELVAHMQKMTPQERATFIEQTFLPLVASKMAVSYDEFEWFEQEEVRTCGYYNHSEQKIALNKAFIASDDNRVITILLNTVIHECKHARQWAAVEGADLGYSQQLLDEWKQNFEDYISPKESDEGYIKQPVEFDAAGFANSIIDERVIFEK